MIWVEEHIYHLVGRGSPYEIFEKDVLNYGGQVKAWGNAESVFIVHYDDLWNKSAELSDFLGFELRLPERRERVKKGSAVSYNLEIFDYLRRQEKAICGHIARVCR